MKQYQIRADFDRDTIVVYQAYSKEIALKAIERKKFVAPFSFTRMTWIKPSFLWMMERSGYARKSGQEYVLAIRIKRESWEKALSLGVLSSPEKDVYIDGDEWNEMKKESKVTIQWDPERNLRGGKLDYRSIQVGVSRHLIGEYVNDWIVDIVNYTPLVNKIYDLRLKGLYDKAKLLLPKERLYPVSDQIKKRLGMD